MYINSCSSDDELRKRETDGGADDQVYSSTSFVEFEVGGHSFPLGGRLGECIDGPTPLVVRNCRVAGG